MYSYATLSMNVRSKVNLQKQHPFNMELNVWDNVYYDMNKNILEKTNARELPLITIRNLFSLLYIT